ncbi:MAG: DUF1614 domain-containing protein [Clostridia bacterium]|nr:DUF1614 domain-containing protein [Clostridia bacterium]
MSIGMILLVVLTLLILFGVLQRVLDRMALTDRQAIACVAAILIGGWLPDLPFGVVTLNIGGAVVPLIVCVYLLLSADTAKERIRACISSVLTAAAITAISMLFPSDPVSMPFDPMLLYGVAAGVIAWLLGRSRRSAFISGILGVIISDLVSGVRIWLSGIDQPVHIGGAGALDAVVLAGVIGVLLCELVGEITERIKTGKADGNDEDGAIEGGKRS